MRRVRTTSHTRFDHKNHIIFCTKYRKPVLKGEIALRLRDITRQVCERNNIEIIRGNVRQDHVPPPLIHSTLQINIKDHPVHKRYK